MFKGEPELTKLFRYTITYGDMNYYWTTKETRGETKNFTTRVLVRENENFRFEEHGFRCILRCKKLMDIIGIDVFAFKVSTKYFHHRRMKLAPNEQNIDVISWDTDWKTIQLIHLDGWSARIEL